MRESTIGRLIRTARRGRFQTLFVCLILFALITPLVENSILGHVFFYGLLCLNLLAAVLAVSDQRRLAYLAAALLLIAFLTSTWSTFFGPLGNLGDVDEPTGQLLAVSVADGTTFVAFAFAAALILKNVVAPGPVDRDKIFAAVCVYLLSGVAWALLYVLVFFNDPGSFQFSFDLPWIEEATNDTSSVFSVFCYFSFVTMTTLGYGDIIPTSDVSRTLAWLQAVLGQLYVAILIARLVGMHTQFIHDKLNGPPSADV